MNSPDVQGQRAESRETRIAFRVIFVNRKLEVLLLNHKSGRLLLPGGGMEPEELSNQSNTIKAGITKTLPRELKE